MKVDRRGGAERRDWAGLFPQWAAVVYTAALSLGLSTLLGRALGPERFGLLVYATSFAAILAVAQDGGFRTLLFREKATRREGKGAGLGPLLDKAFLYVLGVTLLLAAGTLLSPMKARVLLCLAVVLKGLGVLSEFVSALLKGGGAFSREALWQVLSRTAAAGAVAGALLFTRRLEFLLLAWSAGLLSALLLPVGLGTFLREWKAPPAPDLRGRSKALLAFLAIDAATLIYFRCDMVLLPYLAKDPRDAGLYASAYRVLEGVILLATPPAHMFFRAARDRWTAGERVGPFFLEGIRAMFLAGLALALAGFFLGPFFLVLLFGPAYEGAGGILRVLVPALVFILPNYFLTQGALAFDMEWPYAWTAAATGAFNIALNLLLVPSLGARGAAWATLASEGLLGCVLVILFLRRRSRTPARPGAG